MTTNQHALTAEDIGGAALTPERRLWLTVLLTAVNEALREQRLSASDLERYQSANWIKGNSSDFREVCELAGINPDALREKFIAGKISRKILKSAKMAGPRGERASGDRS